jgi:hypothetical protein
MYQDYGTDLKGIMTSVQCPICFQKFTVRLGVDFLSRRQGQEIKVICISCAQSKINEIKRSLVN